MRLRVQVHWAPKAGSSDDEYEDAFWPARDTVTQARAFRCALGDGATESSFSGQWARLLVRAYCRRELDGRRRDRSLPELGRVWRRGASAGPLPWYAEQKLEQGAFSSLLGLHLEETGQWRSLAVGDTCLFHIRTGAMPAAFPLECSDAFINTPLLISSVPRHNRQLHEGTHEIAGEWRRGDTFLLMTDAIACWYLRCVEGGHCPTIPRLRRSFGPWLAGLRASGTVRNDDTTIMRVEMM
jgi:hypothetical protein